MEHFMAKQFEQPPMLVDPIIPWGGMFVIHGPRAAGKSQLALELMSAVANGRRFLDVWECRVARVLLVEIDMTPPILQERLRLLNGRFPSSVPISILTADGSINIVQLHPTDTQGLMDAKRFEPELVVVDSLRKTHILDENDSATPEIVYQAWRRHFPKATLGFLHHDRKVVLGPFAGDVDEAFRGTTAWLDNVDTGMHLVRDKKIHDEHRCLLTFSKVRTCEQPRPMGLRLHPETLAIEPADTTPRLALLAHLEETPGDRFVAGAVRWMLQEQLCSKPTAYRIAHELGLPEASVEWRSQHGLSAVKGKTE
jgi:AAA domain-containing protein